MGRPRTPIAIGTAAPDLAHRWTPSSRLKFVGQSSALASSDGAARWKRQRWAWELAVDATTSSGQGEDFVNRLWTNLHGLWMMLAVGAAYAYELRQSGQVVSTGRLTMEDQLELGDELTVAGVVASVTELRWVGGESRLLLEPVPSPSRS
jgi:hypothetical protein